MNCWGSMFTEVIVEGMPITVKPESTAVHSLRVQCSCIHCICYRLLSKGRFQTALKAAISTMSAEQEGSKGEGKWKSASKRCANAACAATGTPLWRQGWADGAGGNATLCNACGIKFAKGTFCTLCFSIPTGRSDGCLWIVCDGCSAWMHLQCALLHFSEESVLNFSSFSCSSACSSTLASGARSATTRACALPQTSQLRTTVCNRVAFTRPFSTCSHRSRAPSSSSQSSLRKRSRTDESSSRTGSKRSRKSSDASTDGAVANAHVLRSGKEIVGKHSEHLSQVASRSSHPQSHSREGNVLEHETRPSSIKGESHIDYTKLDVSRASNSKQQHLVQLAMDDNEGDKQKPEKAAGNDSQSDRPDDTSLPTDVSPLLFEQFMLPEPTGVFSPRSTLSPSGNHNSLEVQARTTSTEPPQVGGNKPTPAGAHLYNQTSMHDPWQSEEVHPGSPPSLSPELPPTYPTSDLPSITLSPKTTPALFRNDWLLK